MKKIFFRADADNKIGFGHFVRTLALAEMLKDDFECIYFTQTPTDYQKSEVGKVCKLVELPADDSKFDQFVEYLTGKEIVFLDNYFYTSEYEKRIKDVGCKLVTISPDPRHHYADIVLNFSVGDIVGFDVEPYTKICRGIEWMILRSAFYKPKGSTNRNKNSFVVCFGGTDQYCLTEKTVKVLKSNDISRQIHVISTNLMSEDRVLAMKDLGCQTHINASADDIVSLFDECEYAILSTSTVTIEALTRGISVIAGYYVDNQYKLCNYLEEYRYINSLGNLLDKEMPNRLFAAVNGNPILTNKVPEGLFATKNKYVNLFSSL